MTLMGISLDFPFYSSDIMLIISSGEQSSKNIEFGLDGFRKSVNDWNFESDTCSSDISLFRVVAIDMKYLLKALAMDLLSTIFLLSMRNGGFSFLFVLPLMSFMMFQVFYGILYILEIVNT